MKKNRIFNIVIVLLSVVFAITLLMTAATLVRDWDDSYSYDADSLLYLIQEGDYADLIYEVHHNEVAGVDADADMQECYAVAKYFEAASKYKAYVQAGESERAAAQQAVMDEQAALMGDLSFTIAEIDKILE